MHKKDGIFHKKCHLFCQTFTKPKIADCFPPPAVVLFCRLKPAQNAYFALILLPYPDTASASYRSIS